MLKWASVSLDITRVPLWCGECKFVINYQSVFLSSSPLSHYFLTLLCGAPPTPIVHVTHWRRAKWFVVRAVVQKWWYSYNGGATSISSPRLLWQSIEKLEKIKNIPLIKFLKGSFISVNEYLMKWNQYFRDHLAWPTLALWTIAPAEPRPVYLLAEQSLLCIGIGPIKQ